MIGFLLWCVVVALVAGAVVAGVALLSRRAALGERREKWHDQTTGPAGAMFNALFLASFALSIVISWQNYTHAESTVQDESSALVALYDDVGQLPDGAQLRGEIRDYASIVLTQEWPMMQQGGSTESADTQLRTMSAQLLSLPTDQDAVQAARSETIKELDQVDSAREQRLRDANTTLPWGLLVCVVVGAVVVLGHGLLVGLPHTLPSLIPLVTEAAMIAGAVFITFAIRQPYHGALDIDPDAIRHALATITSST
jgi:hypothetical protein